MEIKIKGKLSSINGIPRTGEITDFAEAEILVSPPTPEQLANLKEGDEVLVRAKFKKRFGASIKVKADNNCKEDVYFVEDNVFAIPPQQPAEEGRIYPCDMCGKMRTKDEGGTTFTVCDECWEKEHPPKPKPPEYCKCENPVFQYVDKNKNDDIECNNCGKFLPEAKKEIEELKDPMFFSERTIPLRPLVDKINELIRFLMEK